MALPSYAALTAELNNDPTALGYKSAGIFKDDVTIAGILNLVRSGIQIKRGLIETWRLLDAMVPSDLTVLTSGQLNIFLALTSVTNLSIDSTNIQGMLNALFPALTAATTNGNLVNLRTRSGSRIEQLYGPGTSVIHTDVAIALGRL